jgi:hypothetical protein
LRRFRERRLPTAIISFEHITIITVITGITDITVIGIITDTIERNFLVKGRCGVSFAVAPHVSGPVASPTPGAQ